MKKIIAILGMFLLINSLFANKLPLMSATQEQANNYRGPTLANHSKLDDVTLQVKSTERNLGPTYSNIAKKGDILKGSKGNNIFWAGEERIIEWHGGIRWSREWNDDCKPGEIIIKNNDKLFKIPYTLSSTHKAMWSPHFYIRILAKDWSVKSKRVPRSYDGNIQLVLTKQDGNTKYTVVILQGPNWGDSNLGRTGVICLDVNQTL